MVPALSLRMRFLAFTSKSSIQPLYIQRRHVFPIKGTEKDLIELSDPVSDPFLGIL